MEKTILLMLSGGLDSTYTLWHYLTKTDCAVHAHHISLRAEKQSPWRWRAEDLAVSRIIKWCRENIRHFDYSESIYQNKYAGWDIDLVMFVASQVGMALAPKHVAVATGKCREDFEPDAPDTPANAIYKTAISKWGANMQYETEKPAQHLTKADMIMEMPRELFELTWSCRVPQGKEGAYEPCGECRTCRHFKRAWEVINDKDINHRYSQGDSGGRV
jgi:7-cyano-7-deazaguanine synthase in queuosine biosynthesis